MKLAKSHIFKIALPIPKVELLRWFLWIAVTLIILFFSILKNSFVMQTIVGSQDKLAHVVVFVGFFFWTKFLIKNLSTSIIFLITFTIGLLIELLQAYFTHGYRQFDVSDLLFNILGIALGVLLLKAYKVTLCKNVI